MPFVLANRVQETTTSTGTGSVTLAGAVPGFQSFAAIGDANNTYYTIAGGTEWEVGIGTYTAAGTTLSRDTVLSSSAGGTTKVNFSAGTKNVFVSLPTERTVYSGGTANLALPAPGTSGNVLTSSGTAWVSQVGATASNVQTFTSTGTWTKPNGANFVLVEVWGAGGGGGRPTAGASNPAGGAGGGGAYNYRTFLASELSSSVTVTIGAGGSGGASNGSGGSPGGTTDFGKIVYGYGGGGGAGTATGANWQPGGGGGGLLGAATAQAGGAPIIEDANASSTSIFLVQNMGGGRGGGQTVVGAGAVNQVNGAASSFGGGGGAGAYPNSSLSYVGGGSSSNGGGGGGGGGYSTAGGSTIGDSAPTVGGGPIPTFRGTGYGAAGGGAPVQPGVATPAAGLFGHGGCGGMPAVSVTTYSNGGYFVATNGAQTAVLGVQTVVGVSTQFIYVSSNGLAPYTTYATGRVGGGSAGIAYDGSKYVVFSPRAPTGYVATGTSLFSTTDFTTFTDYTVPTSISSLSISSTYDNPFNYINGRYFISASSDLYYSSDLTNWTRANVAGGSNVNIRSIAYDGTRYYVVSSVGNVYVSTDLTSWTSYASGASTPYCIAASASLVVVAAGGSLSRYSTDNGVTWSDLPTIASSAGRIVRYISATNTWVMTTSAPDIYYSTTPTTSWTLATDSASATGYKDITYNGTYYIATGASTGANVVSTTSSLASAFTLQAASTYTAAATAGGAGGIAGGGGGGAASSTTTSNGGNGGSGYCRVYTW